MPLIRSTSRIPRTSKTSADFNKPILAGEFIDNVCAADILADRTVFLSFFFVRGNNPDLYQHPESHYTFKVKEALSNVLHKPLVN
jgi:hypothetical protein